VQLQLYGIIAAKITIRVGTFVEQHNLGYVAVAVDHQTTDGNILTPAIAFYSDASAPLIERGYVFQMPELAVEIKFPYESMKVIRDKAAYYLANGCRIVWLVHPEKRIIDVHTSEDETVFMDDDILNGGDVLPGFSVPVRDLFPPKA
jgi:Uma2 family endonuclease